jgi:hypothetical protein
MVFAFIWLTDDMLTRTWKEGKSSIDLNRFDNDLGPSLLVVIDVPRFLELVIKAIRDSPEKYENSAHGQVKYVTEQHHGRYSIFHKPDRLAWQNEFRIVLNCQRKEKEPLHLRVPGLGGVCAYIEKPELVIPIKRTEGGFEIQISSR